MCNKCEKIEDMFGATLGLCFSEHSGLCRSETKLCELLWRLWQNWIRGESVVGVVALERHQAQRGVMLEGTCAVRITATLQHDLWLQNYWVHQADGTSGLNPWFGKLQMCDHLERGCFSLWCCVVKSQRKSLGKAHSCPVALSKPVRWDTLCISMPFLPPPLLSQTSHEGL